MSVHVSYAEIEQAVSQLGQGREEITAKLQQLSGKISGLVSSGFVTEQASGRFQEAYQSYTQSTTNIVNELLQIEGFLRDTAQAVKDLDAQIAARINAR